MTRDHRVLALLAPLALFGCGEAASPADAGVPVADAGAPVAPTRGRLLIEELYYAGAAPNAGTDHYFSDQFVELVNASDTPLDLSGVLIGEVFGVAGEINPGTSPDSFRSSHPDRVVMSTVWAIPAGVTLAPGAQLVVAHDGTNHRPFSAIDLSGAELEAFVPDLGDEDSPTVANLEPVHFGGGRDWLITVFGPSLVILAPGTALEEVEGPIGPLRIAPTDAVLDAIETLMDADASAFKRLPDAVDVGHAYVAGPYTGESLHRRRTAEGWQDTDDSGADFEVRAPDPGFPAPVGETRGEPWIELGTGTMRFEPVAEGSDVELVAGLQGGWHLDVSVRFGGFGPDGVSLVYDAVSAGAEPISFRTEARLSAASVIEEADAWVRLSDRVVLDIADPSDVVGTEVVVRVSATLGEHRASDERIVRVVDE